MAIDPGLAGVVLRTFTGIVSRWLRRRAREHGIWGTLKTGGVTVVQRVGSALNLNVHFHTLMMDGVYQIAPELRAADLGDERLNRRLGLLADQPAERPDESFPTVGGALSSSSRLRVRGPCFPVRRGLSAGQGERQRRFPERIISGR